MNNFTWTQSGGTYPPYVILAGALAVLAAALKATGADDDAVC